MKITKRSLTANDVYLRETERTFETIERHVWETTTLRQ